MERTAMSDRDLLRVSVLSRLVSGELTSVESAELLALSVRQVKRLKKRYVERGAKSIRHALLNRPSNHGRGASERDRAIEIVRDRYGGSVDKGAHQRFGPTLAAEQLLEDEGMEIPVSTLRRWMVESKLWTRRRKWRARFKRRDRKEHFGELVQLDGSFHDWLEGRGPYGCLMTMTDDATGTVYAQISKEETHWAAANVLRGWIELYGVPRALYTDWKNVYHSRNKVRKPLSQFGVMCEKLGIKIIAASSPQAKGRVERTHGTNQDRLIKKLRLRGVASYDEMNRYLREHYLPAHNARFARSPSSSADYHLPINRMLKPRDLWCWDEERTVSNDGVVSYERRMLQLDLRHDMPRRARVIVRTTEEADSLRVIYRTRLGTEHELRWRDYQKPAAAPKRIGLSEKAIAAHKARHAAPNHPWRGTGYLEAKKAWLERRLGLNPTEVP